MISDWPPTGVRSRAVVGRWPVRRGPDRCGIRRRGGAGTISGHCSRRGSGPLSGRPRKAFGSAASGLDRALDHGLDPRQVRGAAPGQVSGTSSCLPDRSVRLLEPTWPGLWQDKGAWSDGVDKAVDRRPLPGVTGLTAGHGRRGCVAICPPRMVRSACRDTDSRGSTAQLQRPQARRQAPLRSAFPPFRSAFPPCFFSLCLTCTSPRPFPASSLPV